MNAPDSAARQAAPTLIGCGEDSTEAPPAPQAIGFKAHNLARMAALGLPVPPAFVLGTAWSAQPHALTATTWLPAMAAVEQATNSRFGDPRRPLLLSVRSGAAVSMPGMMETLLNIGLTDTTLAGLLRGTGNPRLVWDAYRRLVAGFGEVVLAVPAAAFEADLRQVAGARDERDLDFIELRQLTRLHQATMQRESGQAFPQDPHAQLDGAIGAVFASWDAQKAREYRRLHGLADNLGTAVTVQAMVFGNAGGTSGAGVGFTRHPSTGEPVPWVDFLFNAQGEDVVSGRRSASGPEQLTKVAPSVWTRLVEAMHRLEQAFGDMQEFEFTVENGQLWMLQTRAGKRSVQARARIALDLFDEGLIDAVEARRRTEGLDADALALQHIVAADGSLSGPLAKAVSAAHGVAIGEVALDEKRARERKAAGAPVLLVRRDAQTSDIAALDIVFGLLTARGARTSHAAVVARELGKVCLVACETLEIDEQRHLIRFGDVEVAEGEVVTLDGNNGVIHRGPARTVHEVPGQLLSRLQRLRGV
jgi:pyruvate,orthophosphate dikinase